MEILQRSDNREYPTEYLTARIKGRSSYLLKNWDNLIFSPDPIEYLRQTHYGEFINEYSREGAWIRFISETRWIYLQMNNELHEIFQPFFIYIELKTLIVCLRHKLSKITGAEIDSLLFFSLFSGKIKKTMNEKTDLPSVLEEFEEYFLFSSGDLGGLKEIFLKDGLKGLEQKLSAIFFQGIIESRLHTVVRDFFTYIIDSKNIITAYKHLRWGVRVEPCFINGGIIDLSWLKKCINENDKPGINKSVYRLTGIVIDEINASNLENTLQSGLTRRLNRMRIENSDIGLILNYLWRCYIEAKNLSIVLFGRQIDGNVLKEELVI